MVLPQAQVLALLWIHQSIAHRHIMIMPILHTTLVVVVAVGSGGGGGIINGRERF